MKRTDPSSLIAEAGGTPLCVCDSTIIRARAEALRAAMPEGA
jgi:hypothetical protein